MVKNNYIINEQTVLIASEFEASGNEISLIIEGTNTIQVNKKPEKIIDETLHHFSYNLAGALKGSRSILGDKYMVPIAINPQIGIVLIQFKTNGYKVNLWISISHIMRLEKLNPGTTKIQMEYGHSIIIHMKHKNVEKRYLVGVLLQNKVTKHTSNTATFLYESDSGFIVIEQPGEYNFIVKKENDEKEEQ